MLGHGLVKATMFVVAGRILAAEGSSRIDDVHGLLERRPDLARPLLAGTAALLGFPPFVLFLTEVAIVIAGWTAGLGLAMTVALLLLLVVFAGFSRQVAAMTLGAAPTVADGGDEGPGPRTSPAARRRREGTAGAPARRPDRRGAPDVRGPSPGRAADQRGCRPGRCPMSRLHATDRRTVTRDRWAAEARTLLGDGWRLALLAAHEDDDRMRVVASFLRPVGQRAELTVEVPLDDPWIPTLAQDSFPAGRFEREIRDLYGIRPEGHPLPQRLVRHGHWPTGYHPMRRDADPDPRFNPDTDSYPFVPVEGDGVYEIPVGPIHAGLIEPGHFRFSVVGETILQMKARLWFLHRGVEKLFEGRTPAQGIELAERISGDTAVGHTLAYVRAVEDALGIEVDQETRLSAPSCSRPSASTTTSTTWAPSPTTSASGSRTPTRSGCASTSCATTRRSPGTGCFEGGSPSAGPTSPGPPTST